MTDNERLILLETEQLAKSNSRRIDELTETIKDVERDQKAIYKIATSVELIAQRVSHIEEKVDDTNSKVDAQIKAWQETEKRIDNSVAEPYKTTYENWNKIKLSVATAICTMIATGIVGVLISFGK